MQKRQMFRLYVINSSEKLLKIYEILSVYAKTNKDIGPIRKEYTRNAVTREYTEKNRRLILLNQYFYDFLVDEGFGEEGSKSNILEIIPYEITCQDYAHRQSSVMHFYFPVNNSENVKEMKIKMEYFTYLKIINKSDWWVHSLGVCEFSSNVDDPTKIMIKQILDSPMDFRVSWCRKSLFSKIQRRLT